MAGHEPAGHERADREERDVAEVEQAREADDDVEPEGHHHVGQRRDDRLVEPVVELVAVQPVEAREHEPEDRPRPVREQPGDLVEAVGHRAPSGRDAERRRLGLGGRAHPSRVSSPNRPCGPEDHHEHEDREHDRGRPGGAVVQSRLDGLLDDPDDQPADHRALEVADAAHDRGGEGDQAGGEALVELDGAVVERVDQARRAGQQAAEQERQPDRAVDVDAHQARGVRVLRRRAHRLAVLGLADEPEQRDQQRDRDDPREEVGAHERDAAEVEDLLLGADEVRRRVGRRAPEQADVLQDERHADRGDQRRQLGRVAQRPVGDPLDHHVEHAGAEHRDGEHEDEPEDQHEDARALGRSRASRTARPR